VIIKATDIITRSTCPYCGVGCGVEAITGGDQLRVRGDASHPANKGKLCVKGSNLAPTQPINDVTLAPVADGTKTDWDIALKLVSDRLREVINTSGPESVAFYLSGQLLTEDYYVANKLMKGFIGSPNVDTNSRLCMSSAVVAYQRAFGEDVVPVNYEDIDVADLVVLVGSNAAWTHPVLYQRMLAAKARGTKFVVIDPRVTATCDLADLHLQLKPGSDVALFNGLLTYLADTDLLHDQFIEDSTEQFSAALDMARTDTETTARLTDLSTHKIEQFYNWFGGHKKVVSFYSQGVNQAINGTDKANAIINCHLATGSIGKPGCGPFSITGQPNAMGGREVGGLSTQLAAHMGFTPEEVSAVKEFWGATNMVNGPGLKAVEMFDRVASGEIKAIWIMATNPVVSLPNSSAIEAALAQCPLVIVSDCTIETDTAKLADVFLPAAGWGEKDGTVTNSERVISRQRAFQSLQPGARPDWQIVSQVAVLMGFETAFSYTSSHQIFCEHAALSGVHNEGRRLFDISYLGDCKQSEYDNLPPTRWPQAVRPFANGKFPTLTGRARFVPIQSNQPFQVPEARHPFILNTGRTRDQWHTMTRTGVSAKLMQHAPAPTILINDQDASELKIEENTLLQLSNTQGLVRGLAKPTSEIPSGQLFLSIHWSQQYAFPCRVSQLIAPVYDPHSGQPESKHGVVSVSTVVATCWVRIYSHDRFEIDAMLFEPIFWVRTPEGAGWLFECALAEIAQVDELLDALGTTEMVRFDDQLFGSQKVIGRHENKIQWVLFRELTRAQLPSPMDLANVEDDWSEVVTGSSTDAGDGTPTICTCFEVSEGAICSAIESGDNSLAALGERLGCGSNCGSCVPELNRIIKTKNTLSKKIVQINKRLKVGVHL
tara:strand:- start:4590 stop:7247 length:2658 start_codon:yes stop_codon:yes gene_type:complete